MKPLIIGVLIFVAFCVTLYFWGQSNKHEEQHPAIHNDATKPDAYLLEALDSEDKHLHKSSAIKIEQAIQAIWKLEKDVDDKSFESLEQTIKKLENVHRRIIRDSIPYNELLTTIEYALSDLAHVELEVAANYSEDNQTDEARTAIKYAQLHLKNALILHSEDSDLLSSEKQLLDQLESLLNRKDLSQKEYAASLDKIIREIDAILERIDKK